MPESIKKTTKSTQGKWTKAQAYGFWCLIIGLALFWGGVGVGSTATQNSINERESIKSQAVEAYKAELSKENQ